jgi:phosphomannomutase/phosphoglucomutase
MFPKPRHALSPNTYAYESTPLVKPTGFREYDARWLLEKEINLMGVQALGMGLGTLIRELGVKPEIVTGHDFRGYSASVKMALISGLLAAGCKVHDIGLAMTPMAYFAQFDLDVPCVAMVTASHNDNGWTGVKMGANRPLTFGPDEMTRLKDIVLNARFDLKGGGSYQFHENFPDRYIADLTNRPKLKRRIKVVCACGNGTAGAFAPKVLEGIGCEVVPLDTELDHTFPRYNPNPEDMEMLHAMRDAVLASKADVGLGFDGDGDRCGVVDNHGEEIFADKIGVMLARDISALHPGAQFVVDVKSTGLFVTDPVLQKNGAKVEYWKTGHSYMKRRTNELGALVGFEKSGHFFFRAPFGRGYDDGLVSALAICDMLDRNPDLGLADHVAALRRRKEIWHRRAGDEAFRGGEGEGRQGCRPGDPRYRHGQRGARHGRGRKLGSGACLVQQAGAGGGGRKPGVGAAHARHVQGDRRRAAHASGSRQVQSDDLREIAKTRSGVMRGLGPSIHVFPCG